MKAKILERLKLLPFRGSLKTNMLLTLICVLFILVLIIVYMVHTASSYTIEFYQVSNNLVNQNIRIIFISDLHNHEYGKDNERLISDIKSLHPDLIISGGDLVTDNGSDYDNVLSLCTSLSNIAPFYGILGNHEDQRIYQEGENELISKFKDAGLNLLVNESANVKIGNDIVELIGLDGGSEQFDKYGAKEFMDSLPAKTADVRICICHVPITFESKLSTYSFDLGLAGHAHGGLIHLPKIGALYSSEEKFFPEYYSGLYELDNAPLIVSRGLGDSSLVPRINNPHELSVIDIKWY